MNEYNILIWINENILDLNLIIFINIDIKKIIF